MSGDESNDEPRGDDAADPTFGFGPLGSLDALTSLQRQGIAAASEVAERFTSMLGGFDQWGFGSPPSNGAATAPGADVTDPETQDSGSLGEDTGSDEASIGDLRANISRGFDMYSRMFQTTFEAWADMVEDRMRDRGVRLGADADDDGTASGPAGGTAIGELWLHNHTSESAGPFHLVATPAFAADGRTLGPTDIELVPSRVEVDAESSVRIEVGVNLTDVSPGPLHALVLVRELPAEALPLHIYALGETAGDEEE